MDKQSVSDGGASIILKDAPMTFTCTSGQLLWGQVHTVIEGFASEALDTADSFRYKVAARKGEWKAEAAILDTSEGQPWHVGFVCHHAGADGLEILQRAAQAGTSSSGTFGDLEIVFVDRYEWSGSHSPGCELIVQAVEEKTVDPEEEAFDDEKYYRSLVDGRFMLLDKLGFGSFIQALKDGTKLERKNYLLRDKEGAFGAHLVVDHSEYDMGWMVFQNDELVGFVYDGAYSGLEGDNLRLGS